MKTRLFILYLISIILLLIVLSGINGCPQQQPKISTTGLKMSFVKDAPPVSVITGTEFPIYVDVLNAGGEFVNKGSAKFYLSNLGPNFENVKSSLINEKTLGKESVFPERLVFAEKAKFTFPLQDMLVVPLVLTGCYDYSGRAQASVCITGSNESKVCKIDGEKIISNTAGPIQITSVTESISRNKLILIFEVANKGNGQVYLADADCDKLEARDITESQKQGKLNIKITTKDNFKCKLQSSSGQVDGLEGIAPLGKIICEKDISKEDYLSVFIIETRYKYRDSIIQNINIMPA
ncbi:MAG: hypothetical protein QW041_01355 [Candidatus Pacearchaeota archaeon]